MRISSLHCRVAIGSTARWCHSLYLYPWSAAAHLPESWAPAASATAATEQQAQQVEFGFEIHTYPFWLQVLIYFWQFTHKHPTKCRIHHTGHILCWAATTRAPLVLPLHLSAWHCETTDCQSHLNYRIRDMLSGINMTISPTQLHLRRIIDFGLYAFLCSLLQMEIKGGAARAWKKQLLLFTSRQRSNKNSKENLLNTIQVSTTPENK